MPQVSLYLDKPLYKEVQSVVKRKGVSMSSFVSEVLKEYLADDWPEEFLEVIGSMNDEPFELPEDIPWSFDSKRETL